ncbi:MAG: porin [Gammaproteobacteria bacterium]|nr:porin [Gammaproteobacteria bacterium]
MKVNATPALLGIFLAGGLSMAAQADVTVFGHIDQSIEYFDQDGGDDDLVFKCTTCSIGFKGKEDLGNGLKAIFKIDFQYDINNRNQASSGTNSLLDRDQWLGLGGNFGELRVGTISTVYKSHGAKLDPVYRTALQQRDRGLQSNMHTGAGEEGQGRATNTARYDTPSWNGLKLGATFTLDSADTAEDDNPYGAGLSYENAGVLLFADYLTTDTGGDDEAYKVGGKYTLNNLAVMAQYEVDGGLITSKAPDTSGDGADTWFVGGSLTLGNSMIYGAYGQADGGDLFSDYTSLELVGTHAMSKRTKLYLGYSNIDCDDQDDNVCSDVGPKAGEDEQWNFGMKHTF